MPQAAVLFVMAGLLAQQPPSGMPVLDFEFFKTRVQPIFLHKRKGNARCVVCHSHGAGGFLLQPLPAEGSAWNEEESRRNFEAVRQRVVPGEPLKSLLLMNPLAAEAGGTDWHSGGKHWFTQDDPEWKILVDWVRGQSAR